MKDYLRRERLVLGSNNSKSEKKKKKKKTRMYQASVEFSWKHVSYVMTSLHAKLNFI